MVPLESLEHSNGVENRYIYTNDALKARNNKLALVVQTQDEWIGLTDAQQLDLPVGCSVGKTSCCRDESRIFIHCVGYTVAGRIYKYKFHSAETSHSNGMDHKPVDTRKDFGKLTVWRESVVEGFEPERWVVEQVWVPNRNDNVRVPMYIVRDKSHVKSGDSFCLLYG